MSRFGQSAPIQSAKEWLIWAVKGSPVSWGPGEIQPGWRLSCLHGASRGRSVLPTQKIPSLWKIIQTCFLFLELKQ